MPGGLLNIISYGNQNIIVNGNPSKTFFKTVYSKYTNFGMQKFRIDHEGQRNLKLNEDTQLTFKIPRNAELLMDAYLVFNLPDIWSTIIPPSSEEETWRPYNFRWISHIGANIIRKMSVSIGGQKIQEFSGEYLKNMVERDFSQTKKDLFYKMIGHTKELYDPDNAFNRIDRYPISFFLTPKTRTAAEPNTNISDWSMPSINGRTIYVPLHFWFMNSPKMALPLVALQYNEVTIDITLRPIKELFTIQDVTQPTSKGLVPIQPDFKNEYHSMYRFLQPPPNILLQASDYGNKNNSWNTDIHLMSTYGFLTDEEAKIFALNEQRYLIKDIKENIFPNVTGNNRVRLHTTALACSWVWVFKRNDVYKRNEWSNYSNWDYTNTVPVDLVPAPTDKYNLQFNGNYFGPGVDYVNVAPIGSEKVFETSYNDYFIADYLDTKLRREILTRLSIIFDGQLREDSLESGIFNFLEKYKNSTGNSDDYVYSYSFSLNTSPFELQPSGAINLSKFKTIELDISTILPDIDEVNSNFITICDAEGTVIGTTQGNTLYKYTYDLFFTEERYNLLRFISGQAALVYAR